MRVPLDDLALTVATPIALESLLNGHLNVIDGAAVRFCCAEALVQLLGMFKQERAAARDLTHREFMEWLEHHRHNELKDLIAHTHHLASEVDVLLREDHQVIMAKLENANVMLVDVLAHVKELSGITRTMSPNSGLSDDAVELIANFGQRGANRMIVLPDGSGRLKLDGVCTVGLDPWFNDDDLCLHVDSSGF